MPSNDAGDVSAQIRDVPERGRFELYVDGRRAGLMTYRSDAGDGGPVTLVHTEVDDDYEGKGIGSAFVRQVLDELAGRGVGVLPECPFVRSYLERHPDYVRLVPPEQRRRFELAEPA